MAAKKKQVLIPSSKVTNTVIPPTPAMHWGSTSTHLGSQSRPAVTYAPPNAPAPTPQVAPRTPVQPFNTPEETLNWSDRWAALQGGLFDVDQGLNTLRANTAYEEQGIDKQLTQDKSNTVDSMIARGLGQSSIQDGELADLQGSATRRKSYLDTTLSTATIEAGRRKELLNNNWNDFIDFYNKRAVANAQAIQPTPAPEAATPAQQMNPLPGLGNLPLSTGFAGLDPSQRYRTATNGRLQVLNSNGTWRYVN